MYEQCCFVKLLFQQHTCARHGTWGDNVFLRVGSSQNSWKRPDSGMNGDRREAWKHKEHI